MSTVIDEIRAERERQIAEEGWTYEHDDKHSGGQLAAAAACYAAPFRVFRPEFQYGRGGVQFIAYVDGWPFADKWWKPSRRRRNLLKAAALIVAEIERLDRFHGSPP